MSFLSSIAPRLVNPFTPCSSTLRASFLKSTRYASSSAATAATKKTPRSRPLIARYTDEVPFELARVQSGVNVNLRDYAKQKELGRISYDLKTVDGMVHPAEGPNFIGALLDLRVEV